MPRETIIILNFGGQYDQLIARKVREANVYCEILPCHASIEQIKKSNPKGIIFAGNRADANKEKAPKCSAEVFELGIPILERFYPKMGHSQQDGLLLKNFLYDTCGCSGEWTMANFAQQSIESLKERIGNRKVLCALSGGVDSSVSAVLLHKAVGSNLICIFVDHGLLRKDEGDQVERVFKDRFHLNLIRVNAQQRFLNRLKGITDPETKRKIIGEEFIRVFEEEARKIGKIRLPGTGYHLSRCGGEWCRKCPQ